jgi:pimeloyl-ACP methyl ester carboxylesterase
MVAAARVASKPPREVGTMFIRVGNDLVNTAAFGRGDRTIVGVGGWIGNWELWQQPFERLSEAHRVVAYDHPGSGETQVPPERLTFETHVDTVFGVLDALDVDRCVLAGESMGGTVAVAAMLRQPERFDALVLVDSPMWDFDNETTRRFSQALRANHAGTMSSFVDLCIPEPDSDHFKRWLYRILMRQDATTAIALVETMYGLDLRPSLSGIQIPVLVVNGELDALPAHGVERAEETAALLPEGRLHVVAGAGHVPTLTRPDEVASAIQKFLAHAS